jgi:hypothetical protein
MSDVISDTYNDGHLSYSDAAGKTIQITVTDVNGTSATASMSIGYNNFSCE